MLQEHMSGRLYRSHETGITRGSGDRHRCVNIWEKQKRSFQQICKLTPSRVSSSISEAEFPCLHNTFTQILLVLKGSPPTKAGCKNDISYFFWHFRGSPPNHFNVKICLLKVSGKTTGEVQSSIQKLLKASLMVKV